jgi:hypothetical protein
MSATTEQRWVMASGALNLALATGMTLAGMHPRTGALMDRVDRRLGGPGVKAPAALANGVGAALGVLGGLLLWASRDLSSRHSIPRWNALTRLTACTLLVAHGLRTRQPRLVWGIAAMDLVVGTMLLRHRHRPA